MESNYPPPARPPANDLTQLLGGVPDPPNTPLRPTKEYEDIELRVISIGFAGKSEDLTLYPEDVMETDRNGNLHIHFKTIGEDAEFVAYAEHMQWHSFKREPHKREKGTLRPDPIKMMRERQEEIARRREERLRARQEGT